MPRVLISYRREDAAGHAGRLYDLLVQQWGPDNVFMDVDTIQPGSDFLEAMREAVARADVVLALIGRQWLSVRGSSGRRRLDEPEDFVRIEIETALGCNIRVIPVLVQAASMPSPGDLPASLAPLARRNAFRLDDIGFRRDSSVLIEAIGRSTVDSKRPPVARAAELAPRSWRPSRAAVSLLTLIALAGGGIGWFALTWRASPKGPETPTSAEVQPMRSARTETAPPPAASLAPAPIAPPARPSTPSPAAPSTAAGRITLRIERYEITPKVVAPGGQVTTSSSYTVLAPSATREPIRVRESRRVLLRGQPLTDLPARDLIVTQGANDVQSSLGIPDDAADGEYSVVVTLQLIEAEGATLSTASASFEVRRAAATRK